MKSSPVKNDLKGVKLVDLASQKELLVFDARTMTEKSRTAGFVGAGISSAGQRFSIATQKEFEYKQYAQQVIIGRQTWVIVAVRLQSRAGLGRTFARPQYEYVLELE